MRNNCLLITPPFTQFNTPYPATSYLKAFLNSIGSDSFQMDLSLEVALELFSKNGLKKVFCSMQSPIDHYGDDIQHIYALRERYIDSIDAVIAFLQNKNPTLSSLITRGDWLPMAAGRLNEEDMQWAFGTMGTHDAARYIATAYLEDIAKFITTCVDPHFGFSRYAERLGRSARTFDQLNDELELCPTVIDEMMFKLLNLHLHDHQYNVLLISVPFPGNLYAAFRIAKWTKQYFPEISLVMGGGFPNTELRSLSDSRVFNYFDYITLDDGELPLKCLLDFLASGQNLQQAVLKRTFTLLNGKVHFIDNCTDPDYLQKDLCAPDYTELLLDQYISVFEILNPMHRLWSDGYWNKLTMAHGCYWGKCSFCDINLDYIKRYEPSTAADICDRMEKLMRDTGRSGFHFVDEAAPPLLMKELALEIIRRKLVVTWWTNIRFEKNFSDDLCQLLKYSGCIAVSGGLEVASPRILKLIKKGVTLDQVAKVTKHFRNAGILVHAYLMYGFPTESEQETINSLEIVRQLFELDLIQSGFWHQFALTEHSVVAQFPKEFAIQFDSTKGSFANNDLEYTELQSFDHEIFSYGLRKSIFNYMNGIGLDLPLSDWFDFKILPTNISPNHIASCLDEEAIYSIKPSQQLIWVGSIHSTNFYSKRKRGNSIDFLSMTVQLGSESTVLIFSKEEGVWLLQMIERCTIFHPVICMDEVKADFMDNGLVDFELFWFSKSMKTMKISGLIQI